MLLFDSILLGGITWYLNRVLAGDYGVSLRWYFPLTRQYWCPQKSAVEDETVSVADMDASGKSSQHKRGEREASVHIHGLRKQFGNTTAVDGLSLKMHRGQITSLLGHNGAGKTTTIGMLTGMIPPTSGYATVAGYDTRTDLALLRENIGVCLQHDCLFPQLTVYEHIQFFSKVKGLYSQKTDEECKESIMKAIEDVALLEKRNSYSRDLSGGMKR